MVMTRFAAFLGVFLLLVIFASVVYAKPVAVAVQNGESVTLHDTPCPLKNWKLAVYRYANGKEIKGCWGVAGDLVITVWEDGDTMPIPPQAFKPVTQI
jgi:hypothetical protein